MSSARAYSPFAVLLVLVLVFAHLTTAVSALAVTSGSRAPSSINGRVQRRSTSVVRHILKRQEVPELDLTAFPTLEECNTGCGEHFYSLFASNSAMRRSRRARQEAVSLLADCEQLCADRFVGAIPDSFTDVDASDEETSEASSTFEDEIASSTSTDEEVDP